MFCRIRSFGDKSIGLRFLLIQSTNTLELGQTDCSTCSHCGFRFRYWVEAGRNVTDIMEEQCFITLNTEFVFKGGCL